MLADLNTKSHPHSRLATLRKMWSIERIEQPETEAKESETEPERVKVKMIRIKPISAPMLDEEEEDDPTREIKEKGYILGAKGNQSETNFLQKLKTIVSQENTLERDYEEAIKKVPKTGMSEIEDILWKTIDVEREKVKLYETAYIQEKMLRMRAVHELRKHEERVFGELNDIPEGLEECRPIFTVPNTPQIEKSDDEAPPCWRESEDGTPQPRTPDDVQRRFDVGSARTLDDLQDRSPRPKRIKTPSQDSDESSGGAGRTKEKFTVPDIVKRYKQEKDREIESSSHSWSRPRINMIRVSPKNEEDESQPKTPEVEERRLAQPSTPNPPEDEE
jgi:hypothetical protein